MSGTIDRIEEFPKDGRLWWVRWVDRYYVVQGGTATPSVEVVLSPLNVALDELRRIDLKAVLAETEALRPIRLFTGYIPRLALGTVFQDGVEVASLPLQSMSLDARDVQIATHGIMDELRTKPSWWKFPYRVINRRDYSVEGYLKSQAVVVTTDRVVAVLPCHEVFRTMYAPCSDIALALTSGPWAMTKSRVVEPSETGARSDGRWQVTLRKRIRNEFAKVLANLCVSEVGLACANGVYTALVSGDGPGYMRAPLPFETPRLRLEARGVWLDGEPRKFLALQIVSMTWPVDTEIVYSRQNSGDKGLIRTPIDRPTPYSTKGATPTEDVDGFLDANSHEDPSATSAVTDFSVPSIRWQNPPRLEKEEKLESFIYLGGYTDRDEETLAGVSPGSEWHGDTDSGSANYSQDRRDPNQRFAEVVEMLDRLQVAGEIEQWKVIPHPRPKLVVGGLPAWHFPTKVPGANKTPGFCYLNREDKRLRGALVCEIHYRGSTVYWLEIEVGQHGGGFKSFVFGISSHEPYETIQRALEIAALGRGVWPSLDEMMMTAGVIWAEFWIHSYVGRSSASNLGHLNESRALQAIRSTANAGVAAESMLTEAPLAIAPNFPSVR